MGHKSNWEQDMIAAQNGDTVAYNRLLGELASYLNNYLRFKLFSSDAVQDLVQEILISIHNARHTYDSQLPFKPWLFKIVQSRLIDYFRKTHRTVELQFCRDDDAIEHLDAEASISQLDLHDLQKAMSELSTEQQKIITALKIEGKSIKDVAIAMSLTEANVKVTAHRAYKSLSKTLGVEL